MSSPPARRAYRIIAIAALALGLAGGSSPAIGATGTRPGGVLAEAAVQRWGWPVDPPRLVRTFVAPETRYSAGHRGVDIAAVIDAEVVAPADGTVHFVGQVAGRPVVSLRHAGGFVSSIEPVASSLSAGDSVSRSQPIGTVWHGEFHCASPCVHFGVRLLGEYVSPLLLLDRIPRSVLLPTRSTG